MIKRPYFLLFAALCLLAKPSFGSSDRLFITSDLQGHFFGEANQSNRPGLARILSHLAQAQAGEFTLVDAGQFFAHSPGNWSAAQLLAVPEAAGYHLLHLTAFDAATLIHAGWEKSLPQAYGLVSANLRHRDSGESLAEPFVVRQVGAERVAFTGITAISPELLEQRGYRHLQDFVQIDDPAESLRETLPRMRREADRVIVFYAGEARLIPALAREFGGDIDQLIQGPLLPFTGNISLETIIPIPTRFGSHYLVLDPASGIQRLETTPLTEAANDPFNQKLGALGLSPPAPLEEQMTQRWPDGSVTGEAVPLRVSATNRALGWRIRSGQLAPSWQGRNAPPGYQFLVLSAVAENRKPRDLITQDGGQAAIRFGFLNETLVLLHNKKRAIPLHPAQEEFENALPYSFILPAPRTRRTGDLIFLIPEGEPESLELRHYHIEYEVISLLLKGDPSPALDREKAAQLPGNDFFGFEIRGIKELDEAPRGAVADRDTRWVAVDVTGYSRLTRLNPANHYRTDLEITARIETGRITPYLRAEEHIQIVTNEGFTYRPSWELGTFPRIASFLPDRLTEARLIFALPAETEDYRFTLYFANMGTLTEGMSGFQDPVFYHPGDAPFEFNLPEIIIDFGLDVLTVELTEVEAIGSELIIGAVITNTTDEPGFWEMEERFGLNPINQRTRIKANRITDRFGNDLPWFFHLPPGEPRQLQLAFPVPPGINEALLDVRGVNDNPHVRLTWDDGASVAVAEATEVPDPLPAPAPPGEAPPAEEPATAPIVATPTPTPAAPAAEEPAEEEPVFLEPRIAPPFDQNYVLRDLGPIPGVPPRYGGLMVWPEDPNYLLIGGDAIEPEGAFYKIRLDRDEDGHIQGFIGEAERFIEAPYNDGGIAVGPEGVIFLARYPVNEIGLVRPGSRQTDKVIPLRPFRVNRSIAGLGFVPEGFPNAGAFRFVTWSFGAWFGGDWVPDDDGLFTLENVTRLGRYQGGPASFVYIAPGSPNFDDFSLLMTDFSANRISAYTIDENANPIHRSRRNFIVDLEKAEGAHIDPLTGDFLFSTFEIRDRMIAVSGFSIPETSPLFKPAEPEPPAPPVVEAPPPPPEDATLILTRSSQADHRYYFILDGSGSLMAPLDGERKFDIARNALLQAIEALGENHEVALRAFGNRKRAIEEGADKDTTLEVPMGRLTDAHRQRLNITLQRLRPMGKTPLTLALQEATADINRLRGTTPVRVILLSDGADDIIPRVDPAPVAAMLTRPEHVDLTIIVFEMDNQMEIEQLQSIATASGSRIYFSPSGAALINAVAETVGLGPVQWNVRDASGEVIASGENDGTIELPPGDYELVLGDPQSPAATHTLRLSSGQRKEKVLN